jgi:hypothetical protein
MTTTALWVTVGLATLICLAWKIAGAYLPRRWLESERVKQNTALLTVALLAGLTAIQTMADGSVWRIDARLPALALAALLLWRKVSFIIVVLAAALLAAGLRWLGWG